MLKSITLHRPAIDNLRNFHDAGADLIVGDDEAEGVIDAARARDLVASHGAAGHHAKADKPGKPDKTTGDDPAGDPPPAPDGNGVDTKPAD